MIRKYDNHKVYLYSFRKFDAVFLLNVLTSFTNKSKPIFRDNNIIDFKFYYGNNNLYILCYRDSLLLLPSSLRKLAINFDVDTLKSRFPYKFVNNI